MLYNILQTESCYKFLNFPPPVCNTGFTNSSILIPFRRLVFPWRVLLEGSMPAEIARSYGVVPSRHIVFAMPHRALRTRLPSLRSVLPSRQFVPYTLYLPPHPSNYPLENYSFPQVIFSFLLDIFHYLLRKSLLQTL